MWISHVQGGAFSPLGHIYLSVDGNTKQFGGFYAFENLGAPMADPTQGFSRQLVAANPISYAQSGPFMVNAEELEGLDVWDRSDGVSPGIGGQVHVTMREVAGTDFWFKHFQVTSGGGNAAARWWL